MQSNFSNIESSTYVHHPVNAYNLVKRARFWIPKLSRWLPPDILNRYDISNLQQEYLRACHGLADIQEQFNLNTNDISNGIIQDKKSGHKYVARGKLNSFSYSGHVLNCYISGVA